MPRTTSDLVISAGDLEDVSSSGCWRLRFRAGWGLVSESGASEELRLSPERFEDAEVVLASLGDLIGGSNGEL